MKYYLLFLFVCCLYGWRCTSDKTAELQTIRYNQDGALTSLDPAFARSQANNWLCRQLYNGLLRLDDSLHVVGDLATNWTVSDDGLVYTFLLKKRVFFHKNTCFQQKDSTRAFIASDVKYSFERLLSPDVNSPGSWVFKGRVDSLLPFAAPNDSTFILRLRQPFRPLLQLLTMPYCSVVPKEAVDFYGQKFRSNAVGTGAYQLVAWQEGQQLIAVPAPHSEAKYPLRISFMTDRNTQFLEFKLGNLDFVANPNTTVMRQVLTKSGQLRPEWLHKINLMRTPFLNTEYLGINLEKAVADKTPFQAKKFRQALNYSINRQKLIATLKNNIGTPAMSGFAPKGLPSYDEKSVVGYSYNPEKAKQLLAEAGFPNGNGLAPLTLYCDADYVDFCTFMAKEWENVGIKCTVEQLESATLRERMAKGDLAFFRASWIADYPDAENFYTVFYSKNLPTPNYTHFKNVDYDRLYEQAIRENNDEKRYDFYHQLDRILIEEAPVVFVFYDQKVRFVSPSVRFLPANAMNLLDFSKVQK